MQTVSKKTKVLVDKIEVLLAQGNYQDAVQVCQFINQENPNYAYGWFLSSCVAYQLNIIQFALHSINQSLSISDKNSQWRVQKAKCLIRLGEQTQALELVDGIMQHSQQDAELLNDVAIIYNDCHQLEKAREIYKSAIVLSPKSSKYYYNLASVERYLGLLDDCEKNCDLSIKYDANNCDAQYMRSNLKLQTKDNNHIEQLNQVLQNKTFNPVDYAKIKYALAKELEDCGNFNASFKERSEGAVAYRKVFNYDVNSDIEFMKDIARVYNDKLFENTISNDLGEGLVFILGLPRTGSTLVERIMSGHSEISSMGELTAFTNIMSEMTMQHVKSQNTSQKDMVQFSSKIDFKKLGQAYIQHIRSIKDGSKYIIDKFPQNSLYIGLIHLALPCAKIIYVEREPMDSCYSIYKELFTDIYQYSYDLDELADYYLSHNRLMEHWKKTLPDIIVSVKYEDLVLDLEATAKKTFDQCHIDWQPQCLDFTKNHQYSMTASASQVRQKLYSTSIGKWRNYTRQLSGMAEKIMNKLAD